MVPAVAIAVPEKAHSLQGIQLEIVEEQQESSSESRLEVSERKQNVKIKGPVRIRSHVSSEADGAHQRSSIQSSMQSNQGSKGDAED